MKQEEQERLKKSLKRKLNKEVKLSVRTETRADELGNMMSHGEPHVRNDVYQIIFLGVYGVNGQPLYIHSINLSDNKDTLWRNNADIWIDENTGITTMESVAKLMKLGNTSIEQWLSQGIINDSEFKKRVTAAEPEAKYLAKEILEGKLHYRPRTWIPSMSVFDEPEFLEKVFKHLDRVI